MFTDRGLEMVSGAQPRSAVGCSVLFCKVNHLRCICISLFCCLNDLSDSKGCRLSFMLSNISAINSKSVPYRLSCLTLCDGSIFTRPHVRQISIAETGFP
ncbi:hypothetical protein [Rubritalea tangerina]|uniref:hypothetical protein n=1 Tax=Rubritalea tangerina TaxID=430798 RepID=UPI0036072EC3